MLALMMGISTAQAQDSSVLLGRLNALRNAHGLPGLNLNGALTVAAQQQAQWMVDTGTISHTHPDGSGPRTRAVAAGYPSIVVGENIYGGTNAGLNDAWTFWLNSQIHLENMLSPHYQDVGIGIAHGSWGSTFVFDFGGSGAPPPVSSSSDGKSNAAAAGPPPYVGGVDEHGNIKHIVQPGDTLGDIALLYGYSWSDLPYMMQLNGLSNVRDLEVGSTFLVPPKDGTYTPTPDNHPPTDTPVPSPVPPTITPFTAATATPAPTDTLPATIAVATAGANVIPPGFSPPTATADEVVQVAALTTPSADLPPPVETVVQPRSNTPWIMIALGVQAVVVIGAGFEFLRRVLRKRR